jgi:hypothetical protein
MWNYTVDFGIWYEINMSGIPDVSSRRNREGTTEAPVQDGDGGHERRPARTHPPDDAVRTYPESARSRRSFR